MAKTLRQFKCRDDLWARVEALAERRGISTDDVLQAALVQLFSKKKKQTQPPTAAAEPESDAEPAAAPKSQRDRPTRQPTSPRVKPAAAGAKPPPPRPALRGGAKLPAPGGSRLPPPGGQRPTARAAPAKAKPLYLYYEGQVYSIDQEQFVIGRGAKYSDLAIKDANISRRHCAIVRRNGEYFIKDLESTNGIEYHGERVDDHKIEEGNVYFLCDHELRFTFAPPA